MIICRLKSTIAVFSKITKVLIVETKLIVDRLLRKRKFVDTSLQILISSCIFGSSILKIFACGALKCLAKPLHRALKYQNFRACGGLTAPQANFFLRFQRDTKGILPYKMSAAGEIFVVSKGF